MNAVLRRLMLVVLLAWPLVVWGGEPPVDASKASGDNAIVIQIQDALVNRTDLGFNICREVAECKKECQDAYLAMHPTTLRMGGALGHWKDPGGKIEEIGKFWPKFAEEDSLVSWALGNGMRPMYLLCYTPAWSNVKTREKFKYPNDPKTPWTMDFCPPDDPGVWKAMVKALMVHHKGKVNRYEVWNEPNTGFYWQGEAKAKGEDELLRRYVDLCKATFEAAREVDPAIRVYTCCPHDDFFGSWTTPLFAKGIAKYTDGICLHVYVGPQAIAAIDNWWLRYMTTIQENEKREGKRFPLVLTEYGYNHDTHPEFGGAFSLAQLTVILGTFKAELATQYAFHSLKPQGDDGLCMFRGGLTDNPTSKTLRYLYALFQNATYVPLNGATLSPGGESFEEMGIPKKPDNKLYAFEIARPDGSKAAYVAAWRGRFCYAKNKLIDIPDMDVAITLPKAYARAEVLDSLTGEAAKFSGFKVENGKTVLKVKLQGIHDGKEAAPRAFVLFPPQANAKE
ncbi:MAG: hypothetical protein NTW87_24775 [Planctomycetota bacterium]|nr:hypothetical protein [Planctomycetota bacterium]